MMTTAIHFSIVILALFACLQSTYALSNERFWVVFGGGFLMKIDSQGKVTLPPITISGIGFRNNSTPAISYAGTNALQVWFLSSSSGQLFRLTLEISSNHQSCEDVLDWSSLFL